jgi:hypothetical protein
MSILSKFSGTVTAAIVCAISIPAALAFPYVQISAIFDSSVIYDLVKNHLVSQASPNKCSMELVWTCSIYFAISLLILAGFFYWHHKDKRGLGIIAFVLILAIQFYVLQTPFFIFSVGQYYNCETDGQSILGLFASSPMVSLSLIPMGVVYDIIKRKKLKMATEDVKPDVTGQP